MLAGHHCKYRLKTHFFSLMLFTVHEYTHIRTKIYLSTDVFSIRLHPKIKWKEHIFISQDVFVNYMAYFIIAFDVNVLFVKFCLFHFFCCSSTDIEEHMWSPRPTDIEKSCCWGHLGRHGRYGWKVKWSWYGEAQKHGLERCWLWWWCTASRPAGSLMQIIFHHVLVGKYSLMHAHMSCQKCTPYLFI